MIYEIVLQTVDPAQRDAHVEVVKRAWREARFEGAYPAKILRSVEDPSRVVLVIPWDTVEAHTRHRGTPAHNRFREAVGQYQTASSQGGHYLVEDL
jgi:quinol monooxygenase YgiN